MEETVELKVPKHTLFLVSKCNQEKLSSFAFIMKMKMFFAIAFSYNPMCEMPLDVKMDRLTGGTGTALHRWHNAPFDTA
jgi:hypothetical protein